MTKAFKVDYLDFDTLQEVVREIILAAAGVKILTVQGGLGAGKTTLIKEICRQLGTESPMSSPTFTMVNEYRISTGDPVFHIDMYRLEAEEDALELGIEEYFMHGCWCFVEWPEKIAHLLPENFVSLKIEVDDLTHARKILMRPVFRALNQNH